MRDASPTRVPIDYEATAAASAATRHFVLIAWCCWAASIGVCVSEIRASLAFKALVAAGADSYDDLYGGRLAGEEALAAAALVLMLIGGVFAYIAADAERPRAWAALSASTIGIVTVIVVFVWSS